MRTEATAIFERRADGVIVVRPAQTLGCYPKNITECLGHWAGHAPDRTFLAQRDRAGKWRCISYAQTLAQVLGIAQSLLNRRLSSERPVMILSGNSIEHALLALACLHVGILYVPVAPAYSLSSSHVALQEIWRDMEPGLVFADDGAAFEAAVTPLLESGRTELFTVTPPVALHASPFAELLSIRAGHAVDQAHHDVAEDDAAKILFTSGSTGKPKGVITTQRMLCSNQEMLRSVLTVLHDTPPVVCDWLPWNHVFGGSHNFGLVLYNGGTLYIDAGKPTSDGFAQTVQNLREIAPTIYLNVPKGFSLLLPALAEDTELRKTFFSRLQLLFSAAAALSEDLAGQLKDLSSKACEHYIPLIEAMGATETGPLALCSWISDSPGTTVGLLPVPGVELKLVPIGGGRSQARLRGPNVTPGFRKASESTAEAFDEEGFFQMTDALAFVDPQRPALGLRFDGRLGEDFKLSTGTWVNVENVRKEFLRHLKGMARDVVLAAPDRDYLTALIFAFPGTTPGQVQDGMLRFAGANPASSCHVRRALLLYEDPSEETAEITAKRSMNQKIVWERRSVLVDELYAGSARVIDIQSPLGE